MVKDVVIQYESDWLIEILRWSLTYKWPLWPEMPQIQKSSKDKKNNKAQRLTSIVGLIWGGWEWKVLHYEKAQEQNKMYNDVNP